MRDQNPVGRGVYTPSRAFGVANGQREHRVRGLVRRFGPLPWIPSDDEWRAVLAAIQAESLRNRTMIALSYDAAQIPRSAGRATRAGASGLGAPGTNSASRPGCRTMRDLNMVVDAGHLDLNGVDATSDLTISRPRRGHPWAWTRCRCSADADHCHSRPTTAAPS